MNFGARIKAVREEKGLGQAELAARAGFPVRQQTIQSLEQRGSKRSEHAPAICAALGIRLEWALTGTGEKWVDALSAGDQNTTPDRYEFVTRVHGAVLLAGGGSVAWEHEEVDGTHAFTRAWLQRKRLDPKQCRILTVNGDSMLEELRDGFVVLIDLTDTQPIRSGKVYAISIDGEQRIKRLFRLADGSLRISSDNPNKALYPDEIVAPEHQDRVTILGRKRWHAGDDD